MTPFEMNVKNLPSQIPPMANLYLEHYSYTISNFGIHTAKKAVVLTKYIMMYTLVLNDIDISSV